jgi:hypothetical protein
MSKKKAHFYDLQLLSNSRPYVTISFFDHKERRMMSSVDVVLNLDYFPDDRDIAAFLISR